MPLLELHQSHTIPLILLTLVVPLGVAATTGITGGDRMSGGNCPGITRNTTEALLVYSPFQPYWNFDVPYRARYDVSNCWIVADCVFEAAGESRKQQFSAAALVMGLIPPTIKDIAWPERRVVYVTNQLHGAIEMIVLALGLVPQVTRDAAQTRQRGRQDAMVANWGWKQGPWQIKVLIGVFTGALIMCYGGLAAMEVFSKRSALGCVVPAFIVTWHIVALVPAGIHLLFSRRRFATKDASSGSAQVHADRVRNGGNSALGNEGDGEKKVASAVQGASEYWPVQMAWAIYYIAGTLVFTSIMAVTVPELTVWVLLGLVTAGCSKILAFLLCLVCEDTIGKPDISSEQNMSSCSQRGRSTTATTSAGADVVGV
jgi:hypothetical protein